MSEVDIRQWDHERRYRSNVVNGVAELLFQNQGSTRCLVHEDPTRLDRHGLDRVPEHTRFVQVWRIGSIVYRFEGPRVLTLATEDGPTFLRLEADIVLTWMGDFKKRDYWKVLAGEDSHPGWANRVFRDEKIRGKRKRVTKRTAAQIVRYIDLLYEADPKN